MPWEKVKLVPEMDQFLTEKLELREMEPGARLYVGSGFRATSW